MTKQKTIDKWSASRKRQVFRGRAASATKSLLSTTDVSDVLGTLSRREKRILSRRISRKIQKTFASEGFFIKAMEFPKDCAPQSVLNINEIEEWVLHKGKQKG